MIVNQTNIPVWRWSDNRTFGNTLPDEDPDGDSTLFEYNLRFAGQYFDSETNLHYNYFRDYDPETGRYLSSDPIGLAGGLNTYGYALQNPLTYTDPHGLAPDALIDLGLIAFDLASFAYNKFRGCDTSLDEASLAANVTGLLIPGATGLGLGVRAAGNAANRTVSKIDFITKPGSKLPNIKTDVSKSEFERNLINNGFTKSTSKDGNVNIFSNGDKKFTTRDFSKSTDGPSAEVFKNNRPISKIRLGDK